MADSDGYVTNDTWVRTAGRPDAIDEVADQFERRAAATPLGLVTTGEPAIGWPPHSRGWHSISRLHQQLREPA